MPVDSMTASVVMSSCSVLYLWFNTELFVPVRWPAMGIHGDKSQQERDWVLNGKFASFCTLSHTNIFIRRNVQKKTNFALIFTLLIRAVQLTGTLKSFLILFFIFSEFKYGKAPILIATDVASRGLGQYPP